MTEAIETYRFNDAAESIYQFVWATFCDWYVELIKPVLGEGDHADSRRRAPPPRTCSA